MVSGFGPMMRKGYSRKSLNLPSAVWVDFTSADDNALLSQKDASYPPHQKFMRGYLSFVIWPQMSLDQFSRRIKDTAAVITLAFLQHKERVFVDFPLPLLIDDARPAQVSNKGRGDCRG